MHYAEQSIEKIEILNFQGQKLKAQPISSKEISKFIGKMQKDIYIEWAKMTDGRKWTVKFVKH